MNKILILVRGYSPELSASGNLIKPLVEELGKNNKVFVLSCANHNQKGSLSKNIEYEKIHIKSLNLTKKTRIIHFIMRRIIPSFHNKEIVSKFKNKIAELDNQYNFDIILAITYEEILALIYTGLPVQKKSVFLLEKLPIQSYFSLLSGLSRKHKTKIESDIFSNVAKVFALPIMHSYLSEKSQKSELEKLIMLEHPMITDKTMNNKNPSNEIILIYAGGLDRKQRNPKNLINFFNKINSINNIKLITYSYGNCQLLLKELEIKVDFLEHHEAIEPNLLEKEINKANIIITIGNIENDIVPSKIFDCISTGKPIIHFSQSSKDPYYKYLSKYEHSLIINYSDSPSEDDIKKVLTFIKEKKYASTDFNTISQMYSEHTPKHVANVINRK